MKRLETNQIIGIFLCGLLVPFVISTLFVISTRTYFDFAYSFFAHFIFSDTSYTIFRSTLLLIQVASILYAAIHKDIFTSQVGRVSAYAMAVLYTFLLIMMIFNYNYLLGGYGWVVISFLKLALISLVIFSSKVWNLLKIMAPLSYVFKFVSIIYWENIEVLLSIELLISIATIILAIFWMAYNHRYHYHKVKKIDII